MSIMSHELRTPLNIVMNCAEIMRNGIVGEINPEQAGILDRLLTQAKNQLTLVNGILHATRMESEQLTLCLETVDLKEFLESLGSDCAIRFRKLLYNYAGFWQPTCRWRVLVAIAPPHPGKLNQQRDQVYRGGIDHGLGPARGRRVFAESS